MPGRYYEKVKALKLTSTLATGSLPQLAIAEFVANGGYDHTCARCAAISPRKFKR